MFYISYKVTKINNNKTRLIKPILKCSVGVFKLAVIPHKDNDYRPHLIRRYGLVILILIITGLQLGYNKIFTGDVLGRQANITISSLLENTNQERVKVGIKPLKINDQLDKAAYLKAQDMFNDQYWAHVAPDGTEPWKWFGDVGYNYNAAGENLAKNFTTTNAIMFAWMNSPEHKVNVLNNDYQDVGFAVVNGNLGGKSTSLVVALYGSPATTATLGSERSFAAVETDKTSLLTQFGIAIQSISPALIGALTLIALAMIASLFAHIYRKKLPKKLRQSWYRHHGLYKGIGLISFGLLLIFLSSCGQLL